MRISNNAASADKSAVICELEALIRTSVLVQRPNRPPQTALESQVLLSLTQALSERPDTFFDHLVKATVELSGAGSAGISLLNEEEGRFVWPAVAGALSCFLGAGTPSNFGPCGTVLERNSALLFAHPEKYFTYLAPIQPSLEEVLLVPFHVNGKAVGTIWAVSHDPARKFTQEDKRLLESLSEFAASAYHTLAVNGALKPFLKVLPGIT